MVALRAAGLLLLGVGASARSQQKVTPVEKVMQLMKKLSADIEAEGKKAAKEYDKFACFCKENADEKLYNIEKSEAKLEKLTAKITKFSTEITTLNADINGLTTLIENKEGEVKTAEELRASQHESYLSADGDMQAAIKALKGAIKALKDSKGSMTGDADVDLAQIGSSVLRVVHTNSRVVPSEKQMNTLRFMSKKEPGHAFEFQSNDILSVLENLKDEFLANKKELDEEEFQTNSDFEKKRLGLLNEIKFADKDKKEKEGILEAKSEELSKAQEDKDEETGAKNADQAFLDELTGECESKAEAWDASSKSRSGELTALSEALESLKSGAADQYSANKKLNLAQKGTSFLQRDSTESETALQAAASQRAGKAIMAAAFKLKSPALTMVAMRVKVAADHFVKVRAVIHDLINKLEDDAEAEATQKSFCDENMQSALNDRDRANAENEAAKAEISKLSSEKDTLSREIQELKDAIAANLKALNEALELRNTEKAENEATIETSQEGKSAVELAINILESFYDNALLQTNGKYVPPNADREGLTVADRAPTVDMGAAKTGESKGIIGLLDVILSDFERTVETTTTEEDSAQTAFNTFEADTKTDNNEKDAEIATKENRSSDIEDLLVESGEDAENSATLKKNALKELEKLKPMCVEGEETYEQRVQKRQKEIEALKDAQVMLNDWAK